MAVVEQSAVYDDLLDVLVDTVDAERLLAFSLSRRKQTRLDELLEKNRQGTLTHAGIGELDEFERIEHVVRVLKARLLQKHIQ